MEKHELYGGKVVLNFDPFKHIYSVNGKTTYGVTSVKDVINKPALMYWAVNQAVAQMERDFLPGVAYDEIQVKDFLANAKSAHRKATEKAASIGQIAHDWISKYLHSLARLAVSPEQPINENAKNSVEAFLDFVKKHEVHITESERKIYSIEHDYAGTLDAEGTIDGKKCIIDLKTSSAIYPEFFIQVAAYMHAREEETGETYYGAVILRVDKETGKFEVKAVKRAELEEYFDAFLDCLGLYKWQMRRKDEEKKTKEQQLTLSEG